MIRNKFKRTEKLSFLKHRCTPKVSIDLNYVSCTGFGMWVAVKYRMKLTVMIKSFIFQIVLM